MRKDQSETGEREGECVSVSVDSGSEKERGMNRKRGK